MEQNLKLSEKLFCLSVNPKNGGILMNASGALGMTLTGSVLVELTKAVQEAIQMMHAAVVAAAT